MSGAADKMTFEERIPRESKAGAFAGEDSVLEVNDPLEYIVKKRSTIYFGRHILHYDMDDLIGWKGLTYVWGTIWTSASVWEKLITNIIIFTVVAIITFYYSGSPKSTKYLNRIIRYLNMSVAFLISLYVSKTVQRWWSVREDCLGLLWTSILNLQQILSVYLKEEDEHFKYLILRYGLLSHALIYKQAQITSHHLEDLLKMGLLTPEELVNLKPLPFKAQAVWVWQMQLLNHLIWEKEKLPKGLVKNITDQLMNGRDSIRRMFSFIESQVPYPYIHLLAFIIHIFHLILPVVAGINFSVVIKNQTEHPFSTVVAIFMVLFFTVIYQGILDISDQLENPLGDDEIDFPRMAYHLSMKECGEAFITAGKTRPFLDDELIKGMN